MVKKILIGVIIGLVFAFLLREYFHKDQLQYYQGRVAEAEETLVAANQAFTEAKATLEAEVVKRDQRIASLEQSAAVQAQASAQAIADKERELAELEAAGADDGRIVVNLKWQVDAWKEKYKVDIAAKDTVITELEWKCDNLVELVATYETQRLALETALQEVRGAWQGCEKRYAGLQHWDKITRWCAIGFGAYTALDIMKGMVKWKG